MTLKHIKFSDSAVMRSLERLAIDKGMVKNEEVVKTASVVEPSGNLFEDMVRLANGLRSKGFVKEAVELEDKIFNLKQAEVHLYRVMDEDGEDLLEFAHPEGDVEVAPAQSEYGKVETLLGSHLKMKEVALRDPKGKTASEDILRSVAGILRSGMEKLALEGNEETDYSQSFEDLTDPENKNKASNVKKINTYLETAFPKVDENIISALSIVGKTDSYGFDLDYIFSNVNEKYNNLYADMAGVNQKSLAGFLKKYSKSFNGKIPTKDMISGVILQNKLFSNKLENLERLRAWATYFDKALGKYFHGYANTEGETTYNPNSILNIYGDGLVNYTTYNDANVSKAADGILKAYNTEADLYLTADKVKTATGTLVAKLNDSVKGLHSSHAFFLSPPKINAETTFSQIVSGIIGERGRVTEASAKGENGQIINKVLSAFDKNVEDYNVSITNSLSHINDILGFLTDNAPTEADSIIIDINVPFSNFKEAFGLWVNFYQSVDKESPLYQIAVDNGRETKAILAALQKSVGKPFSELNTQISKYKPGLKNWDDFINASAKWLEDTKQMIQSVTPAGPPPPPAMSADDGLNKSAELKPLTPQAPGKAPAATPGKAAPGAAPKATKTPDSFSDSSRKAVARMQMALGKLGSVISDKTNAAKFSKVKDYSANDGVKLISTGPGGRAAVDQIDGVWGPKTSQALAIAKKYVPQLGDPAARWVQANNTHSEGTEQEAEKNADAIYTFLQRIGIAVEDAKVKTVRPLDKIPQVLEADYGTMDDAQGHSLFATDLSSLRDFHEFLQRKSLVLPGVDLTKQQWTNILSWFMKRADYQKKNAADNFKDLKSGYYSLMLRLWQQYTALVGKLKIQSEDQAIPTSSLPGGRGAGEHGQGSAYRQSGRGRMGPGGNLDGESVQEADFRGMGGAQSNPEEAPVGKYIPIKNTAYYQGDLFQEAAARYLPLAEMENVSGPIVAGRVFSPTVAANSVELEQHALQLAGVPLERLGAAGNNQGATETTVYWRNRWFPFSLLQSDPQFMQRHGREALKNLNNLRVQDSMKKYESMLHQLNNAIPKAVTTWMNNVQPTAEQEGMTAQFANRWRMAIAKQLKEIQDWRRGA